MIREGMRDRARELRAEATAFEQAFWACVRAKRLGGVKFRRQQVIGGYVVDFVCMEGRLVVELDGDWHLEEEQRGYDAARDAWLTAEGYRVMRVRNREWMGDQVGVLGRVEEALRSLLSNPSPQMVSEEALRSPLPNPSPQMVSEEALRSPLPNPSPQMGEGLRKTTAICSESASLAPLPHLGGGAGGEGVLRKENQA